MYSLSLVAMSEETYNHIHKSKYHYWSWVVKFYATHPKCLWRDLWWRWMPGEVVRFNSTVDWEQGDFERWLWDNVGIKNLTWGLRIDNWGKGESYNYAVKIRVGKTKYISQLALIVR